MKKVICKIEYDTDASELIQKKVFGVFGDPKGYEESLYKTQGGKFFLYGYGGTESPYPEETIKRLAADKVKAWQNNKQNKSNPSGWLLLFTVHSSLSTLHFTPACPRQAFSIQKEQLPFRKLFSPQLLIVNC